MRKGSCAPRALLCAAMLVAAASLFAQDAKGLHAFAYDPAKPVNGGKQMAMKFWTNVGFEYLYKTWAEDYSKIHSNVKIDFTVMPWEDYWKKLPLAIASGQGPDVFGMHNEQTSLVTEGNLAAPYPAEWKPQLVNDFDFVESHLIKGNLYYIDSGVMSSMIFYNKKLWREAGLKDGDIPQSWDQLAAVAKKLTKTDASGKILQEGFGINGNVGYMVDLLSYQQGSTIYKPGGRQVVVDDAHRRSLQRVIDWFDKDKICSRDFPGNSDAFGQGKSAMIYSWGWLNGYLIKHHPDIEFGIFRLPTWDGKTPPAYDRNNGESTFCVNAKAPAANRAVGFDFIHYCIDNDGYNKQMALQGSQAPVMKRLKLDKDLQADASVAVTLQVLDRTVWPGVFSTGWDPIKTKTVDDGIKTGMAADKILAMYENENNKDLAKYKNVYWDQERVYKHAADMLK
jgi:multiple sugar transport system substrate-binding protein